MMTRSGNRLAGEGKSMAERHGTFKALEMAAVMGIEQTRPDQ